jgi:hypothetical protein
LVERFKHAIPLQSFGNEQNGSFLLSMGERWMRRKAIPAKDSICCRLYNLWRKIELFKSAGMVRAMFAMLVKCNGHSKFHAVEGARVYIQHFLSFCFDTFASAYSNCFCDGWPRFRAQSDEHSVLLVARVNIKDCELRKRNKQQSF